MINHKWKKAPESWDHGRGECWQNVTYRATTPDDPADGEEVKCGALRHEHLHIVKQ